MRGINGYKVQLVTCAVMSILAAAAAFISGLICEERTVTAIRLYFDIHPAAVMVAVSLEALFLVSPVMMNETAPDAFFRSAAETSIIAAAVCEIIILTTERKTELMASIAMPYILLTLTAFAIGFAVIRAAKSNLKQT